MSKSEVRGMPVGIDLGTTYSCVAVWFDEHQRVEIITNEQGNRSTPSCVAWNGEHMLIGEAAKNQIHRNPRNTVFDVKRLMGSSFGDSTVQNEIGSWPFKVITQGSDHKPMIVFEQDSQQNQFSPEEISGMILKRLKEAAQVFLGTTVTDAVITVPAYFNDVQRRATMEAANMAGLNVLRLLSEPTAAAITYGIEKKAAINSQKERSVLIFDLGGGTFDVSLLKISNNGVVTVKAVGGDAHLGGVDIDRVVVAHCVREFQKKENKDVRQNMKAMIKLKVACEKAKRDLSSALETVIEIDSLCDGIDFTMNFSRGKFEQLNDHLFKKCILHVDNCLKDGKVDKSEIDDIVMVGGSTRIPKVRQVLTDYFGSKSVCMNVNADEAVAQGAALLAANLSCHGNQTPPEVVLFDVIPNSLGIKVKVYADVDVDGDMRFIIPRNTPIPITKEKTLVNQENQISATISVFEGESKMAKDNTLLGKFVIDGIPAAAAKEQKIKVQFNVDANGILVVTAEVVSTGCKRSLTISKDFEEAMKKVKL